MLILFIWVVLILPYYSEKKIIQYLHNLNAHINFIKHISTRTTIFLVSYTINEVTTTQLVYYNILGKLTWKDNNKYK